MDLIFSALYLLQLTSSLPSLHSAEPEHCRCPGMHSPSEEHWNCRHKMIDHLDNWDTFYHHTGISSQIRTKLRDWAVWQARAQLLLSGSIVLK